MDCPFPAELLIRSDADLTATWRTLLGDLVFAERLLWLMLLAEDGRATGPLLQLTDLPDGPYGVPLDDLVSFIAELIDGPGSGRSVAFLLTRPGRGAWHIGDRAWTRSLQTVAGALGGRTWPVHRARDGLLEACPMP